MEFSQGCIENSMYFWISFSLWVPGTPLWICQPSWPFRILILVLFKSQWCSWLYMISLHCCGVNIATGQKAEVTIGLIYFCFHVCIIPGSFLHPKKIVGTSIGGITSISVGYGHVCGGIFSIFDEWRRDQPTVNSAVSSQASLGCLEKSEQARQSKPVSSVLHNFSFKPLSWVPVFFALSDGLLSVS